MNLHVVQAKNLEKALCLQFVCIGVNWAPSCERDSFHNTPLVACLLPKLPFTFIPQ